ncbi:MAG: glycoside hydrolase family 19 protein, partial [Vibrio sp.]
MKEKYHLNKLTLCLFAGSLVSTNVYAVNETAPPRNGVPTVDAIAKYNEDISLVRNFSQAASEREQYPNWLQLPVFELSRAYEQAGVTVRFTDGQRWGVFSNKWWIQNENPSFTDSNNGAWELLAETDSNGYYLPESVTVNIWDASFSYSEGEKVKHTINGQELYFQAKYWTRGNEPVLTVTDGGNAQEWETPWKKIDDATVVPPPVNPEPPIEPPVNPEPPVEPPIEPPVNPEPPVTPEPELPSDFWNETTAYSAGDKVKHNIAGVDRLFEARYWTQGDKPVLTISSGGTIQDWETPWKTIDNIEPPVNPEPPVEPPIEPPVNPEPPVTPEPQPPIELPAEGYEFLRELTDAHWNWLFPMRSGRYNPDGGTRNAPPFALADGSTDTFTLNAFKSAVLEYNTWAKKQGYKQFLNEGTKSQQALEFTTFWAKSARETSGSWENAPAPWIVNDKDAGIVWKGALYWVEEVGYTTNPDGTSPAINYV